MTESPRLRPAPRDDSVIEYLQGLQAQGFWGSVSFKFEGGRVTHIREERNLKPGELSGGPKAYDKSRTSY